MPTQKELLDSAKKIDERINNAKSVIKAHKKRPQQDAASQKAKQEARQIGNLI